jgi:hypothetical protein
MVEQRHLVQTLVLNGVGEILLCRWKDGPCEGKFTGCLGDASEGSNECSACDIVRKLT